MRLYEKHILPRLTHLAMGQDQLLPYRRRAVSGLHGRVLEIGIGSGLNLALYPEAVRQIIGVDPSPELLSRAAQTSHGLMPAAEIIEGVAEALPLEDRSVDCVVATWALCSFVEHGLAPEPGVRRWQRWLTPVWKHCAGNCHLDRPTAGLIETSGFRMERLDTGYATGPKPLVFMYEGQARLY